MKKEGRRVGQIKTGLWGARKREGKKMKEIKKGMNDGRKKDRLIGRRDERKN